MTLKNNINALVGRDIEAQFKNSIHHQNAVITKIQKHFKLSGSFDGCILSGIHGEKADVKMGFTCGHNIDVNIKGYKPQSAFNQLTRASVKRFCEIFNISDIEKTMLENIVVEKSKITTNYLFADSEQVYWKPFFEKRAADIVKWGLSYKASREILALFDRESSIMRIYPMKEVMRKLPLNITFTKGGFNIGNCISFQRKGGNGSLSRTIPKTSIKHPGNDIQLKMKTAKFVNDMQETLLAEYII